MQPKQLLTQPLHCISLGFGAGLAPVAPGTAGTLVAIPLVWLCAQCGPLVYVGLTLVALLWGCYGCGCTAAVLAEADPPSVVWDEIVGFMITMMAGPFTLLGFVAGFALFRLLDIFKPWPINWVQQRFSGGLGIMLDDVAAGIIAFLILQISVRIPL